MGPFTTTNPPTLSPGTQANPEGVGLGGPEDIKNQLNTLIAQWNTARILSKPPAVRAMILLRQKGQGGNYDTEPLAREARQHAAANLDPTTFDQLIDVDHAGLNAYETLMIRAMNPPLGMSVPMPDLAHPFAPYPDLTAAGPQPFSEWVTVQNDAWDSGVGSQWTPLPDDKTPIGETWKGLAKRTATAGVYQKKRFLPGGYVLDRWVRIG